MAVSKPKVWVTEVGARRSIVVRWREASGETGQETIGRVTGKKRQDDSIRREAEVRAKEILDELERERHESMKPTVTSWHEFRRQYESDYLPRNSKSNAKMWRTAANHLESALQDTPEAFDDVRRIDVQCLERMRSKLHDSCSPASIDTYVATVRAGLSYAEKLGIRPPLPACPSKKAKPKMRGRPLTIEELERMIAAAGKVVGNRHRKGWEHWIRGLYLSGLRLGESLAMSWDDPSLHRPMLERIPKINFAPEQKNGMHQVIATTPDFADFLREIPCRTGFVFNPTTREGRLRSLSHASRRLSEIGEKAKVSTEPGRWASAHDLRRTFGSRWALLVMPPVLQHMMRHASIETTAKFYMNHTADLLGREISEAFDKKHGRTYVSSESAGETIANAKTRAAV